MNGIVVSYMHHDNRGGALVEILTDTDFAAKSEVVSAFGKWVAMIAYGFNFPSWEYMLEDKKMRLDCGKRLDDLKAEVKEEIKVGRITLLKVQ